MSNIRFNTDKTALASFLALKLWRAVLPVKRALCINMDIEEIYKRSIAGEAEIADFESCASCLGLDIREVFNKVSLLFATRFNQGNLSFDDADFAMNEVWPLMLDYVMANNLELFEPCYSIYRAFDEGEYDHRDGCDPVEKYTKPAIKEILKDA